MVFLIGEVGWHFSFLLCAVLPPIAAYLGIRGKREIHTGLSATAFGLAFLSLPLMVALASLEG
jgi:predicted MFS family arabinose efflux permease